FCAACVEDVLGNVCPNCGGGFEKRPIRPEKAWREDTGLVNDPAGTKRRHTPYTQVQIEAFSPPLRDLPPPGPEPTWPGSRLLSTSRGVNMNKARVTTVASSLAAAALVSGLLASSSTASTRVAFLRFYERPGKTTTVDKVPKGKTGDVFLYSNPIF